MGVKCESEICSGDNRQLRDTFVEMLFALAVGQVAVHAYDVLEVIDPYTDPRQWEKALPAFMHLSVALVVTATSWVGWMQSRSPARNDTPQSSIEANFWKLMLDVWLVILYFIAVQTVEVVQVIDKSNAIRARIDGTPSGGPECIVMMVIFTSYIVWDLVHDVCGEKALKKDVHGCVGVRIRLAIACCLWSALGVLACWGLWRATDNCSFVGPKENANLCDIGLIATIFCFRAGKYFEYPIARVLGVADFPATLQRPANKAANWVFIVSALIYSFVMFRLTRS